MAEEKSASAAPATAGRRNTVVFAVVAVVLAAAIIVVAVLQRKGARALRETLETLRQDVQTVRNETDAKDRLLTDLLTKLDVRITGVGETLKTLAETDSKIQEELTILRGDVAAVRVRAGLPSPAGLGKEGSQTQLTGISQQELIAQLASLGDRIEKLKTDVIFKENKVLQDQITDTRGRIDQADREVKTLQRTINEADLPSLKTKVGEVTVEVQQAEADVKALSKAHEAFKNHVTGFFQEVFYNDPWGKFDAQNGPKAK